jgi:hypothetical protein
MRPTPNACKLTFVKGTPHHITEDLPENIPFSGRSNLVIRPRLGHKTLNFYFLYINYPCTFNEPLTHS